MKLKTTLRSKKYLNRIYLLVTAALLVIVAVFSMIIYYNVESTIFENEKKTNQKILFQVKYLIDYMDETIQNLLLSTYYNTDTVTIMFGKEPAIDDLSLKINRLRTSIVDINPSVHSINIYNRFTDTYYSTYVRAFFIDSYLEELINSYDGLIPKMKPILRKIDNSISDNSINAYKYVFSYLYYDSYDSNMHMNGALVMNVKAEWLMQNINKINSIEKVKGDKVFILNSNGELIENIPEDDKFKEAVSEIYNSHIDTIRSSPDGVINLFNEKIDNKAYLISYLFIKETNWVVIKTRPYDEVYLYINNLKDSIILITIVFLALTLLVSITVSRGIYKPIRILMKQVIAKYNEKGDENSPRDEISYLHKIYLSSSEQLDTYRREHDTNKEITRTYFLRKLLLDSISVSEEELVKAKEENNVLLKSEEGLAVCLIRIDNYKEYEQNYSDNDKELTKLAIIKMISDLISTEYVNEVIDIKFEQIVIILNTGNKTSDFSIPLCELIKQAQKCIMDQYKISISASISENTVNPKELTKLYNNAINNSVYRFVNGWMSIITPREIEANMENLQTAYSPAFDRKLAEEIKTGNLIDMQEVLSKILHEISKMNYNNIMLSVMHLVNTIRDTVEEINKSKLDPVRIDFNFHSKRIMASETIDELSLIIMDILNQIIDMKQGIENEKHVILIDAVTDIIKANYFDPGLCLQQAAFVLKMSPQHVGKVFKAGTGISVAECINEVRLEKALEWLGYSNLSINEIALKIGMENESYFYKLFKKRYGVTPKEYSLNRTIKTNQEQAQ